MSHPNFCVEPLEVRVLLSGYRLDSTFAGSSEGLMIFRAAGEEQASAVALLPDAKLLVAGTTRVDQSNHRQVFLARLNPDGTLDRSFGVGGRATSNLFYFDYSWRTTSVSDMAVQPDGRILVAGQNDGFLTVFRFLSNGAIDHSFHGRGFVHVLAHNQSPSSDDPNAGSLASSLSLLPNGKILVAGRARVRSSNSSDIGTDDITLVLLTSHGFPDKSFVNHHAIITTNLTGPDHASLFDQANDVAVDHHNRIVVAASSGPHDGTSGFALLRYNPDGTLDHSFSDDGIITGSAAEGFDSLLVLDDDSIVITGPSPDGHVVLIRYDSSGKQLFAGQISNDAGKLQPQKLVAQPDGKYLVVSNVKDIANEAAPGALTVCRFNQDGSPDTSFNGDSFHLNEFLSDGPAAIAAADNGRIIIAGAGALDTDAKYNALITRLTPSGQVDATFGNNGHSEINIWLRNELFPGQVLAQPDGKTLIRGFIGGYRFGFEPHDAIIYRLDQAGHPDITFSGNGNVRIGPQSTGEMVLSNQKILIPTEEGILRLNSDGSPDNSFVYRGPQTSEDDAVFIQPLKNGQILVARNSGDDWNDIFFFRLDSDGALDRTFGASGITSVSHQPRDLLQRLYVRKDGKVVAVGDAYNVDSAAVTIVRLNPNGDLDQTFSQDGQLIVPNARLLDSYLAANGDLFLASNSGNSNTPIYLTRVDSAGIVRSKVPIEFHRTITDQFFDPDGHFLIFDRNQRALSFSQTGQHDPLFHTGWIDTYTHAFDLDKNLLTAAPDFRGMVVTRYSSR